MRSGGRENFDAALFRNFIFGNEQRILTFRWELYNVFNHTNFTGVNTTVRFDNSGNPTGGFGAVNSSGPGRILSLGLKLAF